MNQPWVEGTRKLTHVWWVRMEKQVGGAIAAQKLFGVWAKASRLGGHESTMQTTFFQQDVVARRKR